MVRVFVTSIQFSDGTEVSVPPEGTVLLVGPNNAGKSQALRDLNGHPRQNGYTGKTVSAVSYEKRSDGDIDEWVSLNVPQVSREGVNRFLVPGWGEVQRQDVVVQWSQAGLNVLTDLFVFHADGTSRLSAGDSQPSLDFSSQPPTHPVQRAYVEGKLEAEIDRESIAAFGMGVTVDRFGGSIVSLRLGPRPEFEHDSGRPSDRYLRALKALPKLEEQGDGVRSYLGLVLHISAGAHQVLLIDEPEAFLHPPQARRLGGVLARRAHAQQAFIATHSTDIVQGALEGGSAITIVRLTRDGDVNHAAVLDDEAVKALWSDPLLRYSNVLDGLFHDAVVLCESDSDCRYYSAVIDNLPTSEEGAPTREPQMLFTHCGGKARLASVVDALQAVSVPVVVVADFDVLRETADVQKIVTSLGGDFALFADDLRVVQSSLTSETKPLRKITLRDEMNRQLDQLPNETITPREADSLRALLKPESGWDKAKRSGEQAIPQGEAHEACQRLLASLERIGLLVVPVGELERFAPGVAGHGPSWVAGVLEQKLHESPGAIAAAFAERIRAAAGR